MKELIKMWRKSKNETLNYYMLMKEHHTYITGEIAFGENVDQILKSLWDEYLTSGMDFRCCYMRDIHF